MYIQDIHSCPLTIISSVLWLTYFTKSYYNADDVEKKKNVYYPDSSGKRQKRETNR